MRGSYLKGRLWSTGPPLTQLPTMEPGWRLLWDGEAIPDGAEEWHETIRRWMPIDGGGAHRETLHASLRARIKRVRV